MTAIDTELTLKLNLQEALELLAAVELSPLEHEVVEQKLLDRIYGSNQTSSSTEPLPPER